MGVVLVDNLWEYADVTYNSYINLMAMVMIAMVILMVMLMAMVTRRSIYSNCRFSRESRTDSMISFRESAFPSVLMIIMMIPLKY